MRNSAQGHAAMAPTNQPVRNLADLQSSATSARMLNLIKTFKSHGETNDYISRPFFKDANLNKCIILKHRLRLDERDNFEDGRVHSTKVILPINSNNLRQGARSFFVGQKGYDSTLEELTRGKSLHDNHDVKLLEVIDSMPSLDPFLMRERLRNSGFSPAQCYFDLTEADSVRMVDFVRQEILPLGGACPGLRGVEDGAAKLALAIMSKADKAKSEPLRRWLGIEHEAFEEAMFCWKGLLYYKWILTDLLPKIRSFSVDLGNIRIVGQNNQAQCAYIIAARGRLNDAIAVVWQTVRAIIQVYDRAFLGLQQDVSAQSFYAVLTKSQTSFYELGDRLAAIQYIMSFWRYSFPEEAPIRSASENLFDILSDFEQTIDRVAGKTDCT
jgi:hypothetical protein